MQIGDILFWQRRKPPRRILGNQHRPYGTQLAYQTERADPSFPHVVDGLFPPSMVPPLGLLVGLKVGGRDRLRRLFPPDAWTGGDRVFGRRGRDARSTRILSLLLCLVIERRIDVLPRLIVHDLGVGDDVFSLFRMVDDPGRR